MTLSLQMMLDMLLLLTLNVDHFPSLWGKLLLLQMQLLHLMYMSTFKETWMEHGPYQKI